MHSLLAAFLGCLILLTAQGDAHRIPKSLSIGCAAAAYQTEGAWNVSDKGVSYWDNIVHTHPDYIQDGTNGDVACDFYHRYKEDVEYISDIGFDHFRFSLAWSRLLPRGTPDYVSQDGVRFYHSLLDELEARNITPVVTLFHWDHPQAFETDGGWLDEKIVDRFGEYVRFVFKEFGPRVKTFVTINEPNTFCALFYRNGRDRQLYNMLKTGQEYTCMHNLLKAHARAYHIYDKEFRAQQKGFISLVTLCNYHYAKPGTDPSAEEVAFQFECGWMAHPIYSAQGDYPEVMKKRIAEMSKFQGLKESKLPEFSKDWVEYVKGTADYYGLNHYSSDLVTQQPKSNRSNWLTDEGLMYEGYYGDTDNQTVVVKHRKLSISKVPKGLISMMRKIYQEYGRIPIYIMENGVSDTNGTEDNLRIDYHYDYMVAMLDAVNEHEIDLRGYTIWSITDNWEWYSGYTKRFGMVAIDFDDDLLKRTPKKSAKWMKSVLKNRELEPQNPSAIALKARLGIQ